jgi:hypothetical protein
MSFYDDFKIQSYVTRDCRPKGRVWVTFSNWIKPKLMHQGNIKSLSVSVYRNMSIRIDWVSEFNLKKRMICGHCYIHIADLTFIPCLLWARRINLWSISPIASSLVLCLFHAHWCRQLSTLLVVSTCWSHKEVKVGKKNDNTDCYKMLCTEKWFDVFPYKLDQPKPWCGSSSGLKVSLTKLMMPCCSEYLGYLDWAWKWQVMTSQLDFCYLSFLTS